MSEVETLKLEILELKMKVLELQSLILQKEHAELKAAKERLLTDSDSGM